jgi:predicted DNA-binding transcriptional regulator YafY
MTARELAECLEVSERTIYRDIEALSAAGIPLYTETGPGGGCELIDGYQTKLTGLTRAEVRALFLLKISGPLADLGLGQALEDALLKLSAVLPPAFRDDAVEVRQRIYMDTTSSEPSHRVPLYLELLQEAVWQDRTLFLSYGRYTRQQVDPYGLVSQARIWYLVGAVEGEMHIMHVSRIRAPEMTERHFIRSAEFDLATYWKEHHTQRLPLRLSQQRRKKRNWARAGHLVATINSQNRKQSLHQWTDTQQKKEIQKKLILKLKINLHTEGINKLSRSGDAIQENWLIISC